MSHPRQVMRLERRRDRRCRGEDRLGRPVEPADIAPHPFGIHPGPRRNIVGKLGVIGGGEREIARQAPAPRRQANRAFGGEMDRMRIEVRQHLSDRRGPREGEPDFGIGRARHRIEQVGRDDENHVTLPLELGANGLQRPHHTIHLRAPRISGDRDAHLGQAASISIFAASRAAISSAQWSNSIRPS